MLPAWPDRPPGQPAPYGKHTRYSQNKMNVKVKMAGGGGGACLRLEHGTGPPPPTTQVNCTGRLHCAGGGRRERRTIDRIKKHRHKKHAPLLTSLSQYWCRSGKRCCKLTFKICLSRSKNDIRFKRHYWEQNII